MAAGTSGGAEASGERSLYEGLEHSSATHLKALGADDRVLAQLAGHRDPRSILRYAKLEPGTVATALRRLRERK